MAQGGKLPIRGNPTLPAQWDILRTEPIEPQDVVKPEDNAETLSNRPNQTLISTQTITHEYLTLSGKVVRETVKVNGSVTEILDFLYDESGRPFALNYSTDGGSSFITYYYILNLQGDVVKLVTSSGSAVATYEYDAWGSILSKSGTMADKNPLRYRGYYYDTETGFYYLQSRYYDPANRRFINVDSYVSTGQSFIGTNMFAYCNNNPVVTADPSGHSLIGAVIGLVITAGILFTGCSSKEEQEWPEDCFYKFEAGGMMDRTQDNCYSYSFGYGTVRDPGELSYINIYLPDGGVSIGKLKDAVLGDAIESGKNVTYVPTDWLDSYKAKRPDGSYLVAGKVSSDGADYHFAILLENGVWIDKPGMNKTRYGKIDGFSPIWQTDDYTYDSETLYFLYTP